MDKIGLDPSPRQGHARGPDEARRWVDHYRSEYETTGNPLFVWCAIHQCLDAELPLDSWILQYILAVCGRLTKLTDEKARAKADKNISAPIVRAFGFDLGRNRNPFRQATEPEHGWIIAMDAYWARQQAHFAGEPVSNEDVWKKAADRHRQHCCGISGKTVEKYFGLHKHDLQRVITTLEPPRRAVAKKRIRSLAKRSVLRGSNTS